MAPDGGYQIQGIPAGPYRVTATAKNHTGQTEIVQLTEGQALWLPFVAAHGYPSHTDSRTR